MTRLGAVLGHALLAVAGDGADDAGLHVDGADAAVVEVGQVHLLALGVEGDAVDAAELRLGRRPAVAGEPLLAGAGEGGDRPRLRVDLADAVVPGVGDVDGAVRADGEAVRPVELGLERRAAVAAVALLARAGEGSQHALVVDLQDALPDHLDDERVAALVETRRRTGRRKLPLDERGEPSPPAPAKRTIFSAAGAGRRQEQGDDQTASTRRRGVMVTSGGRGRRCCFHRDGRSPVPKSARIGGWFLDVVLTISRRFLDSFPAGA